MPRGVVGRERSLGMQTGDLGNRTANTGPDLGLIPSPGNSKHRVLASEIAPFSCKNHKPDHFPAVWDAGVNNITSLGTTSFWGVIEWKTSTDEDLNVSVELRGWASPPRRGRVASTKTSPGSRCPRGHRAHSLYLSSSLGLPGFLCLLPAVSYGVLNTHV